MNRDFARKLRREMTDAERALWRILRDRRFDRVKFRRQVSLGRYVADFLSYSARLIVEVDGSQHGEERSAHDLERTAWLESHGFRVLRFWNNEVLGNLEGVVRRITEVLEEQRHRSAPPPA